MRTLGAKEYLWVFLSVSWDDLYTYKFTFFLVVPICYMCRCLSKVLFSGQRTFTTFWPFVTIYTPQTRSLYDITTTFLTVLWARNRTVLTITSWCGTSSNSKTKWILRDNIFSCILFTKWTFPVPLFYISRKHENQLVKLYLLYTHHIFLLHTIHLNRRLCHQWTQNHLWDLDWHISHETCMVYCTQYALFANVSSCIHNPSGNFCQILWCL